MKEYDGRVRLVMKDLPLSSHPLARPAAEAARCAGAEGRYWAYHDRLFEEQPRFERERLIQYAVDLGLDEKRFTDCLDDHRYAAAVDADAKEARARGIKSTPTFLINERVLVGAQPIEAFREVIAEALRGR